MSFSSVRIVYKYNYLYTSIHKQYCNDDKFLDTLVIIPLKMAIITPKYKELDQDNYYDALKRTKLRL